ncbi:MAG TPA: hypothetical protein PLD25_23065 [Chloroflexota bacterium]|nr:hypothetical protein [Chloroflexota bacterium]HUM70903.1 hypothetical protein [Chloroflexota bacterium]
MKQEKNRRNYVMLILLGMIMLILLGLGHFTAVPTRFIVALETIDGVWFAALALWCYANGRAHGGEWWQDDEASGWRGDW